MDDKTFRKAKETLDGGTLEVLLRAARDGRLSVRVGQILRVSPMRGTTILLLDYDSSNKPKIGAIRKRLSAAGVQLVRARLRRSPGGRGWHGILHVRGHWGAMETIALQAICESDPTREAANFYRAQIFGEKEWRARGNVLFVNTK